MNSAQEGQDDGAITFGDLLRQYRQRAGLTQEALAERAAMSVRGIQDLERGVTRPLRATARRLAMALRLDDGERRPFEALSGPAPRRRRRDEPVAAGSAAEAVPPLHMVPPPPLHALPVPLTPFIGRAREIADVVELLRRPGVRVLALTGPGGIGKTRLAIHAAGALAPEFADGVAMVELAGIAEIDLLLPAIAQACRVRAAGDQDPRDALIESLGARELLLVLDNFEHLLAGASRVADVVARCPGVRLLVTSRVALRVRGEREYRVPPLTLPDPARLPAPEMVGEHEAVALFVERAQAIAPRFTLTAGNAQAVAAVCRRLDGLPLAIELAAARIRSLTPAALLARLDRCLPLLTDGPRDLPERQQTLRGAIAWSYDLLRPEEQALFRRLGVFRGGCMLHAVEAICARTDAQQHDVLALMDALVAASLLQPQHGEEGDDAATEPRFAMLETIREFACEAAAAQGEMETLRREHALVYLEWVEAVGAATDMAQHVWLAHLEREHENIRAALAWAREIGEAAIGLRMAGALWRFWYMRDHHAEGRRAASMAARSAIQRRPDLRPVRAKALYGAGVLANEQGDTATARAVATEALALFRALDDATGAMMALNLVALAARAEGDYAAAGPILEEALGMARRHGHQAGIGTFLSNLGIIALDQQDFKVVPVVKTTDRGGIS